MGMYSGPVLGEPLPIELHNTLYALRGEAVDGLADAAGVRAWVVALGERWPPGAARIDPARTEELRSLRAAVREALEAALEDRPMARGALAELNRRSAGDPRSLRLAQKGSRRSAEARHHAPSATDALLGVVASATIELVSGPDAVHLRTCGRPGCVLMFLKDHPRREWCSATCGNRVRQARHYARRRAGA